MTHYVLLNDCSMDHALSGHGMLEISEFSKTVFETVSEVCKKLATAHYKSPMWPRDEYWPPSSELPVWIESLTMDQIHRCLGYTGNDSCCQYYLYKTTSDPVNLKLSHVQVDDMFQIEYVIQ